MMIRSLRIFLSVTADLGGCLNLLMKKKETTKDKYKII